MLACPLNRSQQPDQQNADAERTVCELCSAYYARRWVNASCGNVSIREGNVIFVAPIASRRHARCPYPLFFLDMNGAFQEITEPDANLVEGKTLMMLLYRLGAGSVIHSHSVNALIVANLYDKEFVFDPSDDRELLKRATPRGLRRIPIIENLTHEMSMEALVRKALQKDPIPQALLIRGHGVYVWGSDWWEAKTYAEHLDYLFQVVINLKHVRR